jgi:hypothetical protein
MNAMIPLGARVPRFEQPESGLNSMMRVLQLKGALDESDQRARTMDRQKKLDETLAGGADAAALRQAGFLKEANEWEKQQAETAHKRTETTKNEVETRGKVVAQYRDALSSVATPDQARQWVQAQYADPNLSALIKGGVPLETALASVPTDSAQFEQWKQRSALGMTEFIKQNKPTITTRNTGATTDTISTEALTGKTSILNSVRNTVSPDAALSADTQRRGQNMVDQRARDANNIASQGNVVKTETDLRKEFADLPEVKRYKAAYPSYKAIEDAAKTNNPQANINLIYGLAKLYDPDSVVREGEYATIANSQAIPEWLKGLAQSVAGGGKLTAKTKAQIMQEAQGRILTYQGEYDKAKGTYAQIGAGRGASPQNLFTPAGGPVEPMAVDLDALPGKTGNRPTGRGNSYNWGELK